uniref:UMA domain-containing protein n=1 Tax=Syphacia muris TaxID=451379 RepID=A0A0N5AMK6_9BILA
MTSGHLQRYIEDVIMDINPSYYPPPLVFVPDITIPSPVLPQYNFSVEHSAIKQYERLNKEMDLAMKQSAMEATKFSLQESSEVNSSDGRAVLTEVVSSFNYMKPTTSSPNIFLPLDDNSNKNSSNSVALMKPQVSNGILMPSRVTVEPKVNSNNVGKKSNITFEEFEPKPNLFDLLEMRTIDDKSLLEQVLSASLIANSMPSSVSECHSNNIACSNNDSNTLSTVCFIYS